MEETYCIKLLVLSQVIVKEIKMEGYNFIAIVLFVE